MAGAVVSTVSALLKDVYLGPVAEQLNNEVEFLATIERVSDPEMVGNQVVAPVHLNRTGGIGSRGELESLPAAGNQGFARALYDLSHHYGRIQVSGVVMAKTKSQIGSFLEALKLEMEYIKNDLRKDLARQVWGASDGNTAGNGRIATCGVTSSSANVVLNSAEPLRKGHLYVGMVVDIGTAGSPASLVNGEAVTAVSVANKTITVTTAITTTTSNFVCRHGNAGKELNNLQNIVTLSPAAFGNLNPATAGQEEWDNQRDTTGGALSIDNMQKLWNQLRVKGKTPNLILTTPGLQRQYFNLLQSQIRYVEPMNIKAGYNKKALAFNEQPLIDDIDGRFGQMYFLCTDEFRRYDNEDWNWLDEDGDVLKWVTGYDAWEAALVSRFQIGIVRRNVHGVLSGLNDSTGV